MVDTKTPLSPRQTAVIIGVSLWLLTCLFPPFAANLGSHGTGEFKRFAFVLVNDFAADRQTIYWAVLLFEWVAIAAGVGLTFYLKPDSKPHDSTE